MQAYFRVMLLTFGLITAFVAVADEEGSHELLVQQFGLLEVAQTITAETRSDCVSIPAEVTAAWQARTLLACLGFAGDSAQIQQRWQTHPVFSQLRGDGEPAWLMAAAATVADFEQRLAAAMVAGLSTGYNIVPEALWPDADPQTTVIYGHADWQHARQLLALLAVHGLRPAVTPVVKKSAFLYRDDWGEPEQELPRLANGQRIVDQLEYDLFLQFASHAEVERFSDLVTLYAKRDSEDETGLIYDAWWQPFYRTLAPFKDSHRLTVMLVTYDGFRVNLMSVPDQAVQRMEALHALDADWQVAPFDIWVNPGFYRGQFGDYR